MQYHTDACLIAYNEPNFDGNYTLALWGKMSKKCTGPMLYAVFIDAHLVCAASTSLLKCIQRMLPFGKKKNCSCLTLTVNGICIAVIWQYSDLDVITCFIFHFWSCSCLTFICRVFEKDRLTP